MLMSVCVLCARSVQPARGQQEALRPRRDPPGSGGCSDGSRAPSLGPRRRSGGLSPLPGPTPGYRRGTLRALPLILFPQALSLRGLARHPLPWGPPGGNSPRGAPSPSPPDGAPSPLPTESVPLSTPWRGGVYFGATPPTGLPRSLFWVSPQPNSPRYLQQGLSLPLSPRDGGGLSPAHFSSGPLEKQLEGFPNPSPYRTPGTRGGSPSPSPLEPPERRSSPFPLPGERAAAAPPGPLPSAAGLTSRRSRGAAGAERAAGAGNGQRAAALSSFPFNRGHRPACVCGTGRALPRRPAAPPIKAAAPRPSPPNPQPSGGDSPAARAPRTAPPAG